MVWKLLPEHYHMPPERALALEEVGTTSLVCGVLLVLQNKFLACW